MEEPNGGAGGRTRGRRRSVEELLSPRIKAGLFRRGAAGGDDSDGEAVPSQFNFELSFVPLMFLL